MTALPAIFVTHGAPTLPLDDTQARDFLANDRCALGLGLPGQLRHRGFLGRTHRAQRLAASVDHLGEDVLARTRDRQPNLGSVSHETVPDVPTSA